MTPIEKSSQHLPKASSDASLVASYFSPTGPIASLVKTFESRKQQVEMATAVQGALSQPKHLVVEAGTGVGKSLAYLVPAALWAVQNKKKVVVATYSREDIPTARLFLGNVLYPMGLQDWFLSRVQGVDSALSGDATMTMIACAGLPAWCNSSKDPE